LKMIYFKMQEGFFSGPGECALRSTKTTSQAEGKE